LREAVGLSHVRALAFQSMFVLLSEFIGQVGLASAFDLTRVRGIIEGWPPRFLPGRPAALGLYFSLSSSAAYGSLLSVIALLL